MLALLLAGGGACAPEPTAELLALERLAFVPSGDCLLGPVRSDPFADCSLARPLVMDLYEVTRADVLAYRATVADAPDPTGGQRWETDPHGWGPDAGDLPAYLSYAGAEALAASRGMRLPTGREWVYVAVGGRGLRYPWGEDQVSVANTLETGIGEPTPVGTFASGRSAFFGCYDMVGNVWEWVSDAVPSRMDSPVDQRALREWTEVPDLALAARSPAGRGRALADRKVSVMGGAYNTPKRETYGPAPNSSLTRFHARRVDRRTLAPAIGARLCADAETYLWEHAARWGTGEGVRRRVEAVGRRWAADGEVRRQLGRLLVALRERPGAPPALGWLAKAAAAGEPVAE